jgi:hypothetical protein
MVLSNDRVLERDSLFAQQDMPKFEGGKFVKEPIL